MKWLIYRHVLTTGNHAGWSYIGLTQQKIDARWKNGLGYENQVFGKAIAKYGWENFEHIILEDNIDTLEKANEREQYWIAYYHSWLHDPQCRGYNATCGGDGTIGYQWSSESRKKLSKAKKGIRHTDEYNAKLSELTGQGKIICIETGAIYYSLWDAYRQTKIRHISECCHGHRLVAGGYHWAFLNDKEQQTKLAEFRNKERHINKIAKRSVRCIETGQVFKSCRAAGKYFNSSSSPLVAIKNNRTFAGFHWEFIDSDIKLI